MRRNVWLLLTALLAGTLLFPAVAGTKGSKLRFAQDQYAPGDRAVAHAEVETWKGSGQPEDGPHPDTPMRSAAHLIQGLRPGTLRS